MRNRDNESRIGAAPGSFGPKASGAESGPCSDAKVETAYSSALAQALVMPKQSPQPAPCSVACGSGGDVRGWIAIIAQRRNLGLSRREAYTRAWEMIAAVNPFPATLGRICPHPCESGCNRGGKDGPVAVNALERFLGDWALENNVSLPRLENTVQPESIGVIGAGPAGISFAYQMARRGYRVVIYEKQDKPGGMLYYGIPQYRLPEDVLEAEIMRVLDLGVELRLGTMIAEDFDLQRIRQTHDAVFLGIGANKGVKLGIPGEDGPNVFTGVEYLAKVNRGELVDLGTHAVVVGGGNTAMDAARAARRAGARVTLLYRRTHEEMPAIASEIDDALAEGVTIEYLSAPLRLRREAERLKAVQVQRMSLGEADDSGRGRPMPVAGSEYWLEASAIIAAVSQEPDWESLGSLGGDRFGAGPCEIESCVWAGGDAMGLGIAAFAIAQGRRAAEKVHAKLRGLADAQISERQGISVGAVKPDYHADRARAELPHTPVTQRLAQPNTEVQGTIAEEAFLEEITRCFSCGLCFGCEQCFMYCNAAAYTKLDEVRPGAYFAFDPDLCEKCGKCIEICPSGFLSPS